MTIQMEDGTSCSIEEAEPMVLAYLDENELAEVIVSGMAV